jgi:hypothetical protein
MECWAFPGEKRVDWRVVDEVVLTEERDKLTAFISIEL